MTRYSLITVVIVAAIAPVGRGADPASELAAALFDLQTRVAVVNWPTTRYVSQYNAREEDYSRNQAVLSFVLNSVSRAERIVAPTVVEKTNGRLLRIDLTAYRLPADVWEAVARDREPYWHVTAEVVGKTGPARAEHRQPTTGQRIITDGGWVDLDVAAKVRVATGSAAAVVRLDWWISRAVTAKGYYSLAGVPETLNDWYRALGVDRDTIIELRGNHGANLFRSDVTHKTRRLSRYSGPLGGVWQTYDNFGDDPAKDPIRNPTFSVEHDASEHIAAKGNGLHWFALFNAKGERQDSVPDRLAKDDSDPRGDGILQPMISCVRCHVEDGLRPFGNDQQRLLDNGVELFAPSLAAIEELASFYGSGKLDRQLVRDREDYAQAVSRATGGLTTKQAAAGLADVFRKYVDERVEPERAARELGVLELKILRPSHDPILLALAAGIAVQRTQFEASYAEAATIVRTTSERRTAEDAEERRGIRLRKSEVGGRI